jgi:hypothetical protein
MEKENSQSRKTIHTTMRVSSFFLFAMIATETVSAQGIFHGRNDDNRVRALVEEVSMSADLSLSFSFGRIYCAEIAGIGKAGKSSPTPTKPPTSKPTRSPVIVIGHGILAGTYLAEYRDSLK